MSRKLRAFAAAALACTLGATLALTGCAAEGSGGSDSAAESSASNFVPEAEGTTSYPLELESPWGSTTLEERPTHIAAVTPSQDDVEALAALGVTPVLASEFATDAWIEEKLPTEIPERFTPGDGGFPIEQIAAADPDLIIVLGADASAEYDRLSDIAPVLSTSQGKGDEGSVSNDWETALTAVGEALDLQNAAKQALADEDTFFQDLKAEHPEFEGQTISYVVYYGAESGLQYHSTKGSPAGLTFENMGLSPSPNAEGVKYREATSNELLSKIDADVIVFSDNSEGAYTEVTDSPLFKELSAAKNDRVILIDNKAEDNTFVIDGKEYQGNLSWALARSGPLSSTWAAEQIAPVLAKTLGK